MSIKNSSADVVNKATRAGREATRTSRQERGLPTDRSGETNGEGAKGLGEVVLPKKEKVEVVRITPPRMTIVQFPVRGTEPLVTNKFSQKARNMMKEAQQAGSQGRSKKVRQPKDFQECFENAIHYSTEGWPGVPASAYRSSMISACRLVGFKMTIAKMAIFVQGDGYDKEGTALVRIYGKDATEEDAKDRPIYREDPVRNDSGVADIRARPMWLPGWRSVIKIKVDLDQFSVTDVYNLLSRAGQQVGIGEGRPDSKNSHGMGWGVFEVDLDTPSVEEFLAAAQR